MVVERAGGRVLECLDDVCEDGAHLALKRCVDLIESRHYAVYAIFQRRAERLLDLTKGCRLITETFVQRCLNEIQFGP